MAYALVKNQKRSNPDIDTYEQQRMILPGCCLFFTIAVSAQHLEIKQSFGLMVSTSGVQGSTNFYKAGANVISDYRLRLNQYGLIYTPRFDLFNSHIFSVSIASPTMVGFSTSTSYNSVDYNGATRDTIRGLGGTSLAFEIPLAVDFNFGLQSAQDESRRWFGFYAGGGYAYSYTKMSTSAGKVSYDGFDPILRAGVRFGARWESRFSIGFQVKGDFRTNGIRAYALQIVKDM